MSLSKGLKIYRRWLREKPYPTHALQTVILMSLGDAISQYIAQSKYHERPQIDVYRTMKFGSIGLLLGPILNKWYAIVDKINFGSAKVAFVKKVILDQTCFAPFVILFITVIASIIDGKSKEELQNLLKKDYFHILLANYKIWPLVQCVNFSVVPLNYRVLVTQSVAVGWNAYLSSKLNSRESQ